jgi:hypothetical protein
MPLAKADRAFRRIGNPAAYPSLYSAARPSRRRSIAPGVRGWQPGADLKHRDYASLADFANPDGNTWVLQEIGYLEAEEMILGKRR